MLQFDILPQNMTIWWYLDTRTWPVAAQFVTDSGQRSGLIPRIRSISYVHVDPTGINH